MSTQQPGDQPWSAAGSGQQHPHPPEGQSYPAQPYPGQSYPAQPYPGQSYPAQSYPAQPYGPPQRAGVFQPPPAIPARPREAYSQWSRRVLASVIDFAPSLVGLVLYLVGYVVALVQVTTAGRYGATPSVADLFNPAVIIGFVLILAAFPWNLYNRWIVGGKTGQSLGKRVAGSILLSEQTGAPIGAGMAFLRDLVHTIDAMAYIGYLWPLWDDKRQTFADKLMQTVVLPAPPRGTGAQSSAPSSAPTSAS